MKNQKELQKEDYIRFISEMLHSVDLERIKLTYGITQNMYRKSS